MRDFGGSLARLGVTVSFVSAAAVDELDRLLNWRKSLGQQLEITKREHPSALDPLDFTAASSLPRSYPIAKE